MANNGTTAIDELPQILLPAVQQIQFGGSEAALIRDVIFIRHDDDHRETRERLCGDLRTSRPRYGNCRTGGCHICPEPRDGAGGTFLAADHKHPAAAVGRLRDEDIEHLPVGRDRAMRARRTVFGIDSENQYRAAGLGSRWRSNHHCQTE